MLQLLLRQTQQAAIDFFVVLTQRALESKGKPIGNNDLWIAAHAKAAALTIVTNNEREFQRIPGLKVQNWIG